MMDPETRYGWRKPGLRVRCAPRLRICAGLIGSAPYVDVVLILVAFFLLSTRSIMGPGISIDLPETTATSGTARGIAAVIRSYDSTGDGKPEEMIYFDHDPFPVGNEEQMKALKFRLRDVAHAYMDTPLLVEADANVRHGTTMMLCEMAREAGFGEVVFATREKDPDARRD